MDCSPSGTSVHGILQVRNMAWLAYLFSRRSSQPRAWSQVSHTAGRLPSEPPGKPKNTGVGSLSLPGDLSNPRVKLESPALKVDSLPAELPGNLTSTHGVPQALGLSPPLPLLRWLICSYAFKHLYIFSPQINITRMGLSWSSTLRYSTVSLTSPPSVSKP